MQKYLKKVNCFSKIGEIGKKYHSAATGGNG